MPEVQQPRDGRVQEESKENVHGRRVPNMPNRLPYLGLPCIFTIGSPEGRSDRASQMGTKGNYWSLLCKLPIKIRVGGFNTKYHKWAHLPLVLCGLR